MNIIRRYKEMIKNILIGTVLVLVMVASAGATEVRVSPASQTVTAGDPFHVDVVVVDVDDLKGNAATLNFDPGAMQVTGITEGDFLKTGGSTIGIGNWDNTAGTAAFGYSLGTGTWTTVSGSGTLATIEFDIYPDALGGTYDLTLNNVEIGDANNELLPRDVVDGTVTILSPPTTATPTATRTSTPDVSEKGVVVFGGTEEGVADTHVTDVIDSTPATTTPTTTTTPDTTTNVSVNATTDTPPSTSTPASVPGLNGTDMIAVSGMLAILFAIRKRKRK
jgi:hypothetical protein